MKANNSTAPSIKLISGAYSSELWDVICEWCEKDDSPTFVYDALNALHGSGKDKEAFALVEALHDIVAMSLPADVTALRDDVGSQQAYISELLLDIENMT